MSKTRVFYVTDIHGSDRMFYKFINAASIYKAQVLIVGGDIAGKVISPIIRTKDTYVARSRGNQITAHNQKDLETLKQDIRAIGDYPYVTTEEDWRELSADSAKMDKLFDDLITESIETWLTRAREKLGNSSVRVIMNKGNDDPLIVRDVIERSQFVEWPDENVIQIDSHELMSLGYSNLTPWKLPGDISEEALESKIVGLVSQLRDVKNSIFNIHVPPYNTHLDIAPKLDKDLKPVLSSGGEPEMTHVGSEAVRRAIEKYQPLVGLHGHIHESRGYIKIGRTHCFNPGSEFTVGILRGVILDLGDNKLESHLLTSG